MSSPHVVAPAHTRVKQPCRTCLGCRKRAPRSILLRIVLDSREGEPSAVVDHRRCLPGRGAWLHPDQECVRLAVRKSAARRALRAPGPVDLQPVADLISAANVLDVVPTHSVPEWVPPTSAPPGATRVTGSGSMS